MLRPLRIVQGNVLGDATGGCKAPSRAGGWVASLVLVGAAVLWASTAQADTIIWSGGPTGMWDTSNANWSGAPVTPWDSSNGTANIAYFNTSGATATVSGTVNANGITFDSPATTGGGTINLAGTSPTITANANATIDSVIGGSDGMVKAGIGTLSLTATQSYNGATFINGGTLKLAGNYTYAPGLNGNFYNGWAGSYGTYSGGIAGMVSYFNGKTAGATQSTTAWGSMLDSGAGCGNFPAGYANNSGQFDAYWQGKFDALTAGTYHFSTTSDDGSGIYIDGTLVVSNFHTQQATTRSGSISLTAGYHDIAMAFTQTGGGLSFNAKYQPPGAGAYSLIPNSVLTTATGSISNLLPVTTPVIIAVNSTLDLNGSSQQLDSLAGSGTVTNSGPFNVILTLVPAGITSFAGAIQDGTTNLVAVTKSGLGTQILSGSNTYSGGTTISGGVLQLDSATGLSPNSPLTIIAGTLDLGAFTTTTSAAVSFQGGVTQNGVIVNNGNAYDGRAGMVSASLQGTGGLIKTTSGILNLTGANTYTGGTQINGGTLSTSSLSTSGNISFNSGNNSGVLEFTGNSMNNYVLDTTSNSSFNIKVTTGNLTVSRHAGNYNTIYKTGGGTLTIANGSGQDGGPVSVNEGTVVLAGTTNYWQATDNVESIVDVKPGATLQFSGNHQGQIAAINNPSHYYFHMSGGTFDLNGDTANTIPIVEGSGTITNTAVGTTATARMFVDTNAAFSGSIQDGAGKVAVTVGASTNCPAYSNTPVGFVYTLSGSNTYTGGTTIVGNTLKLDYAANPTGVLSSSTTLTMQGATLYLLGKNTGDTAQTLGNVAFNAGTSNAIVLDPNNGTGTTLTLGGTWTRSARAIVLFDYSSSSNGTRTIRTNVPVTGSGAMSNGVFGYALVKDSNGILGFAAQDGGNNIIRYADETSGTPLAIGSNSSTTNFTTLNSAYTAGTLTWTNGGTLGNRSVNSLTIDTAVSGGTIDMGGSGNILTLTSRAMLFKGGNDELLAGGQVGATGSEVIVHQTGTGLLTINSLVSSGAGSFVMDGTGVLSLGAANLYTGTTTVNSGTLRAGSATAFGPAASASLVFGITSTGKVQLYGNDITIAGLNTDATMVGTPIVESGSGAAGTDTLTVRNASNSTFDGVLQDGSTRKLALVKSGSGTLTLGGSSTYSGDTTIANGTLILGSDNNRLSAGTTLTLGDGLSNTSGQLVFSTTQDQTLAGLLTVGSGTANFVAGNKSGRLILNIAESTDTFDGQLIGSLSLTKSGNGTLILSGSDTYTGSTMINQGKLTVDGWLTNSVVTVNSGGTLGGAGYLDSATVKAGGHLSPGNSPGILYLSGNLTLVLGAVMDYDLKGLLASDKISMPTGNLFLSGQQFSDFNFTPQDGFGDGVYTLIDARLTSGSLGAITKGTIGGYAATLAISGNDLVLNVVPEPSTFALLGVGGIGLLGWAWRRRKRR